MAARGDATRDKLLDAATSLVREIGYARTTTRAIAHAAGVAEGTLYRHYPDKASLFAAAIHRRSAPVTDWVRQLAGRAGTGTVAGNLTECLTRLATLREDIVPFELAMLADPELSRPLPPTGDGGAPEPGPPEFLTKYLRAEQQLNRVRSGTDPGKIAIVLLAVLFGLAAAPPQAPAAVPGVGWPDIADAVQIIVNGIAPTAPEP